MFFPFRNILRLPTVLRGRERVAFAVGAVACVAGIILASIGWYRSATVIAPAVGGTYVEGLLGAPRLVNPLFAAANDVDQDLARLLFAGLFRIDANGTVIPDLASGYTISKDGKEVTVTLRDGVRWHDGAEFTADDVIFTIGLLQSAEVSSPLRGAFRGVTVRRVDDHTVVLAVERPLAVFLSALTVGILPEHLWIDVPPQHLALAEMNLRPIGTGPYRFAGLTKDRNGQIRSYAVDRYTGYHRSAPFIEHITFRFAEDEAALMTMLDHREVDGIGTLLPMAPDAIARTDVVRWDVTLPQTVAIFLNRKRNDALDDVRVREALSVAINRDALLSAALTGTGIAIGGPIIPGFAGNAEPPDPDVYDHTRAEDLLDRAKWERVPTEQYIALRTKQLLLELEIAKKKAGKKTKELAATDEERTTVNGQVAAEVALCDGCAVLPYHRMANGKPLAVTLTAPDAPELRAVAERVRDAWHAIGVRTTTEILPVERIRGETIPERGYDALLFSQILGPDPDPFPFWHSSQVRHPGLNLSYFSDKAIDTVLEDARGTLDHDARATKYAEFQRRLHDQRPAVFLFTPRLTYAVASAVRGITLGAMTQPADRFATVEEWYITTTRRWRDQ